MKKCNWKQIKITEKVHLILLLFIIITTITNMIVDLITGTDDIFFASICLPMQFMTRFIVSYNPFEITVSLVLLAITILLFVKLFNSYSLNDIKKYSVNGILTIWYLLISAIIPIFFDIDLFNTENDKCFAIILCVFFGLAFSLFSVILFFIQANTYANYMDKNHSDSISSVKIKYRKEYYHTLKRPLVSPLVYAIVPLIVCSFLIYFGVKSMFLTCFIYSGFVIGVIYHTVYNILDYTKAEKKGKRTTSIKNYKMKLTFLHTSLLLLYCISLFAVLLFCV